MAKVNDPSAVSVLERVVIDTFLRTLPYEAMKRVSQGSPTSVDDFINLIESHQVTADLLRSEQLDRPEQRI